MNINKIIIGIVLGLVLGLVVYKLIDYSFPDLDFIPKCPVCKKGTSRQYMDTKLKRVNAPCIYDKKGNKIMDDTVVGIDIWKCLKCGKVYGYYNDRFFGKAYIDPNEEVSFKVTIK